MLKTRHRCIYEPPLYSLSLPPSLSLSHSTFEHNRSPQLARIGEAPFAAITRLASSSFPLVFCLREFQYGERVRCRETLPSLVFSINPSENSTLLSQSIRIFIGKILVD